MKRFHMMFFRISFIKIHPFVHYSVVVSINLVNILLFQHTYKTIIIIFRLSTGGVPDVVHNVGQRDGARGEGASHGHGVPGGGLRAGADHAQRREGPPGQGHYTGYCLTYSKN